MNISECSDNLPPLEFLRTTGMAVIVKRSPFTRKTHRAVMKMTERQYEKWTIDGFLIQEALPHLTAEEREFLLSGSTPEDWGTIVRRKSE